MSGADTRKTLDHIGRHGGIGASVRHVRDRLQQGVLKAEPDNVDALVAMFENVREAEGASSQAAQYLARALAIEPANSAWRMALLELYLRDNRKADVVALLQPIANMPHGGADTAMASDKNKRFAGVGTAQ